MNSSLSPERRSEITFTNIDTSDCGVVAIQAVTGLRRSAAERLAKAHGYQPEVGMQRGSANTALRAKGWAVEQVEFDPRETPATFAMTHEYGSYLVYIDAHVMALVDGDLHNSRGEWHSRVESVYQVSK